MEVKAKYVQQMCIKCVQSDIYSNVVNDVSIVYSMYAIIKNMYAFKCSNFNLIYCTMYIYHLNSSLIV